ncbi:MAG: hypothetical protein LBG79_00500 [Spirochaetaceae bacterium]|jgi:DNA-binding transcriptional regulator YiaG|nr:hypothetical protein [Spirochaetaceae bacterium]
MEKYQSKIAQIVHDNAKSMFCAGGISESRMREYDEACLVQTAAPIPRISSQKPAAAAQGACARAV